MPVDEGYRPMPGEPGYPGIPSPPVARLVRTIGRLQHVTGALEEHLEALIQLVEATNRRSTKIMGSVEDLAAITQTLASDEQLIAGFVQSLNTLNATQTEQIAVLTEALAEATNVPQAVTDAVVALTKTSQDFEALVPVAPEPPAE